MFASPAILVAVAAGGALGSVGRYLLTTGIGRWLGTGFPYGTLAVNVIGCFVMGVLSELALQVWSPGPELRAFLMVGVLGGFTTFSSLSLDVGILAGRDIPAAAGYVLATVVLTIVGFFAGLAAVRSLAAVSVS